MNENMDTNPCSLTSERVSNGGDSPDGLKFGKKIYFEYLGNGVSSKPDASCGGSSSPCSLSLPSIPAIKKTKPSRCQVEGCRVDLTGGKTYYCRHKVCPMHSKCPKVIVDGIEQRFCQQCSRFHQLSEFDQGKRSCRRRLAGHNERRRKPTSGSSSSCFDWLSYFQENSSKAVVPPETFPYPRFPVRDPWEMVRTGESASASRSSYPPNLLHYSPESPAFHALHPRMNGLTVGSAFPGIPPGQSLAGSNDCGCALSLLSPQIFPARYRAQQGVTAKVANNHCPTMNNASMGNSWNHRCNGATSSSTLHEEAPGVSDLGLTSASHRITTSQPLYAETEHEHLNGFTSGQLQMPWSL